MLCSSDIDSAVLDELCIILDWMYLAQLVQGGGAAPLPTGTGSSTQNIKYSDDFDMSMAEKAVKHQYDPRC